MRRVVPLILLISLASCGEETTYVGQLDDEKDADAGPGCDVPCGKDCCPQGEQCVSGRCQCVPNCEGRECGDDGCGSTCGTCAPDHVCNPETFQCDCVPESNEELCGRLGYECGAVTANDNCGERRTVESCGICSGTKECYEDNTCGPCRGESDVDFCQRNGFQCGWATATDNCGEGRTTHCGGCSAGTMCDPATNTCGAPVNDGCATPLPVKISGTDTITLELDTTLASDSGDGYCRQGSGADIVYALELGKNADLRITVEGLPGQGVRPVVYVRRECDQSGTEIGCVALEPDSESDSVNLYIEGLVAGNYFVWVDSYDAESKGAQTLTIAAFASTPPNDECAHAQALSLDDHGRAAVAGWTWGAKNSTSGSCVPMGDADVFYRLDLAADSVFTARVRAFDPQAGFQPALYVLTSCGDKAEEVLCAAPGGTEAGGEMPLEAGSYYLVVDAFAGRGEFVLEVEVGPALSHDTCDGPKPLVFEGESFTAVVEEGEAVFATDDMAGSCAEDPAKSGGDLVYSYEVPVGSVRNVEIEVVAETLSTLQPVVSVRRVCADAESEVECIVPARSAPNRAWLKLLDQVPGTYFLWVDGLTPGVHDSYLLTVSLLEPDPPANDRCPDAIWLTFDSATQSATQVGTTVNGHNDSTGTCAAMSGPEVVYGFTLTEPAMVRASVRRDSAVTPAWRPALYIRGACEDDTAQAEKACGFDESSETANATAGHLAAGDYYLIVDGLERSEGNFTLEVKLEPPIDNQVCGRAKRLVFGKDARTARIVSDTTFGADAILPSCHTGSPNSNDLVFSYELTDRSQNVDIRVEPLGSSLRPVVSVRSVCEEAETEIGCARVGGAGNTRVKLKDQPPGVYYIWVSASTFYQNGPFTLEVALSDPLAPALNDTCEAAELLHVNPVTHIAAVSGDTDAARPDLDGASCSTGTDADLVYELVLDDIYLGKVTVTPKPGSALLPVVSVRRDCGDPLTEMGCVSQKYEGIPITLQLSRLDPGSYFVIVDSLDAYSTGAFDMELELTPTEPPLNDQCATAEPLTLTEGQVTVQGTTLTATNDDRSYCSTLSQPLIGPDVVYRFTLDAAAAVTATVNRAAFSPYRPAVSIRRSCDLVDEVACDRDKTNTGSAAASVSLPAGTYYVFVDGLATGSGGSNTAFGPFTLTLKTGPVIPGDGCGNPIPLTLDSTGKTTVTGDLSGATESGLGNCYQGGGQDMVYVLHLTSDKTVTLDLKRISSTMRCVVYLRRICHVPESELGCAYGVTGTSVTINRVAAGTYYVWADSFDNSGGQFELTVETSDPAVPAPANDRCARAESLDLDPVSRAAQVAGDTAWASGDNAGSCAPSVAMTHSGGDLVYELKLEQPSTVWAVVVKDPRETAPLYPAIYLREGACADDDPTHELACAAPDKLAATSFVKALPAGTYYLFVDSPFASTGNMRGGKFLLDVAARSTPPPDNDECASAEPFPLDAQGWGMVVGDLTGKNDSTGGSCSGGTGPDLVYRFTTTATRTLVIEAHPGAGNWAPALYLRSGQCESAEAEVGCATAPSGTMGGVEKNRAVSLLLASVPAGEHFLWLDSASGSGVFALSVRAREPQVPGHDTCVGALPIALDGSGAASVTGTTFEARNDYTGSCATASKPLDGADVVYSGTLEKASRLTAKVTGSGSTPAYMPAVYIQTRCGTLEEEVGCGLANTSRVATAEADLAAGPFTVIVDGISQSFGEFTLELSTTPLVEGDTCLAPYEIVATGMQTLSGTTLGMTNGGDPTCYPYTGGDVVYAFSVGRETTVDISITTTNPSGYSPAVAVRSNCDDSTSELVCGATGSKGVAVGRRIARLPAGTYYLVLDAITKDTAGPYSGTVTFSDPLSAPGNDTCALPEVLDLVGGQVTVYGETDFAYDSGGGTCDPAAGPDVVYKLTLGSSGSITAKVTRDTLTPGYLPVVYIRSECGSTSELMEVACAKQTSGVATATTGVLLAGDYWIWVDGGHTAPKETPGKFTLEVTVASP